MNSDRSDPHFEGASKDLCPDRHASPPDPPQTPRISSSRACTLINLLALPFSQSLLPRADAKGPTIKFSTSSLLITIRNAGGVGGGHKRLIKKNFDSPILPPSPLECALTSHPQLIENTAIF